MCDAGAFTHDSLQRFDCSLGSLSDTSANQDPLGTSVVCRISHKAADLARGYCTQRGGAGG